MRKKCAIALTIFVSICLFSVVPASAQTEAPGSVQFLESREISLTFPAGQAQVDLLVKVIHSSPSPLDITLEMARFSNEKYAPFPAVAIPDLPQLAKGINAGQVYQFKVTFQRVEGLEGAYAGELVATGSNGSVARLPLRLEIETESDQARSEPISGADPEYLEELNRKRTNLLPSFLAEWGWSHVPALQIETSQAFSDSRRLVGQVASDTGPVGMVWQDGNLLEVNDLQRAGKYSGKLDLEPGVDGGEMKLIVSVRDCFFWPLAVIVVGLLLATWMDWNIKVTQPRLRLKTRLDELKMEAVKVQNEFANNPPSGWPSSWKQIRVYLASQNGQEPDSLFAKEALKIQQKFQAAKGDAERKNWAADGEEVIRLEGYLDILREMYALAGGICEYYNSLKVKIMDFESLPVAEQAVKAVSLDNVIKEKTELARVKTGLVEAAEFIEKFYKVYVWLEDLEKIAQGEDKELVEELLRTMRTRAVANLEALKEIEKKTREAAAPIEIGYQKRSQWVDINLTIRELLSLEPKIEALERVVKDIPDETPEETLMRLNDLERRYFLVSALLVIGTGFYTLYLANPTFGSVYDYFNALLWGTGVTAGFQLARSLFPSLAS